MGDWAIHESIRANGSTDFTDLEAVSFTGHQQDLNIATKKNESAPSAKSADACYDLQTIQSLSTSTSIFVRRKQSSASCGRQTTGSFSLKLVFRSIGTPVMVW